MARTFNDLTLMKIVVMEEKIQNCYYHVHVCADVLKSKNKAYKSSIIY